MIELITNHGIQGINKSRSTSYAVKWFALIKKDHWSFCWLVMGLWNNQVSLSDNRDKLVKVYFNAQLSRMCHWLESFIRHDDHQQLSKLFLILDIFCHCYFPNSTGKILNLFLSESAGTKQVQIVRFSFFPTQGEGKEGLNPRPAGLQATTSTTWPLLLGQLILSGPANNRAFKHRWCAGLCARL